MSERSNTIILAALSIGGAWLLTRPLNKADTSTPFEVQGANMVTISDPGSPPFQLKGPILNGLGVAPAVRLAPNAPVNDHWTHGPAIVKLDRPVTPTQSGKSNDVWSNGRKIGDINTVARSILLGLKNGSLRPRDVLSGVGASTDANYKRAAQAALSLYAYGG